MRWLLLLPLSFLLLCAPSRAEIKGVIIFIADGWGFNQIVATDDWSGKEQVYETFPLQLAMSTCSWNTLQEDSLGYDSRLAHSDWNYVLRRPTDSAAAATAMSTGVKAREGQLNVDPLTKAPLKTILQRAEELGKSTGVVTSVFWSDATPAGFVAHDTSRQNYRAIAIEMLDSSGCEVIMGCGHPLYDRQGRRTDSTDYRYVGGKEEWEKLASGRTAYALIETRAQFQTLMTGDTPARVCGTAQIRNTLQQERMPVDSDNSATLPYAVPLNSALPTLAEMTRGALNVLDNNPRGFCLMVEGGAVDWANHDRQLGRVIEEMLSFNGAVQAVMDWMQENDLWEETLVIVTGDHETGYLGGLDSGPPATRNPIVDHGKGRLPGAHFYTDKHTNSLVPFFANTTEAGFDSLAIHTDPRYGEYIDNTDIAKVIFRIW